MIILGLSGLLDHDASAALLIDGEIAAAAEEERFIRRKHALGRVPIEAAKYCLDAAGIDASQVDVVTFPYGQISLTSPARWHYARRNWYAPDRTLVALFNGNRRFRKNRKRVMDTGMKLGIDWTRTELVPVEHHLSHASSAYHLSGFEEKTAIMCIDGVGEYATTFLGYGENGVIHRIKEFYAPDSLGGAYGAITQYLGFGLNDGEFKVMGMACYGDPDRYDLSRLIRKKGKGFEVNTRYINTLGLRRHRDADSSFIFSNKLIKWLGPRRTGDAADEPYVDYAAAFQRLFEDHCLSLMENYLGDILRETGRLAFAGGGALNVKLNQRIVAKDYVKELFVQPAAGDSGTALGAATYVAMQKNTPLTPMTHAYLGPVYSNEECLVALEERDEALSWQKMDDVPQRSAELLAGGHPVAWFHGRMEFGPRALGARSILGCPNIPGISDRINEQIKFRERWRPFCPSILDSVAPDIIQTGHPAPFMTITFDVAEHWKPRIPEVVHVDGTSRVQVVNKAANPRYYALLEKMDHLTGNGVLLNTSLNRRGEPIVCTPQDALNMFVACDLKYLVLEDYLVTKIGET